MIESGCERVLNLETCLLLVHFVMLYRLLPTLYAGDLVPTNGRS
jgi:hypothetical protein